MSTSEASPYSASASVPEEFKPYRAVSRSAVLSLIFAVVAAPIAILTLVSAQFHYGDAVNMGFWTALFSVFAVALGWAGLRTIRRFPSEYTGKLLARIGLAMGLVQFVLGVSLASYTYATEVPDGYTRVLYSELQPDYDHPELPIPPRALELSGKPIFIKGYMHPGVQGMGKVNHFVLVFDYGTCCFGGQPKPTHMIEVRIPEGKPGLQYSTHTIKLAGTFQVGGGTGTFQELTDVWYHLNVDQVR
jgi:hypothetical protein